MTSLPVKVLPRMVRVRMKADVAEHEGKQLRAGDELDVQLEYARGWIGLNKAIIVLPPDTATVQPDMAKIPPSAAKGKSARAEKT